MSWYQTREQATKVAKMKTDKWGEEFIVLPESVRLGKDPFETTIYWAQRKSALNDR